MTEEEALKAAAEEEARKVPIVYVGPHDAVELPDGQTVGRGETVRVAPELAGFAPELTGDDADPFKRDAEGWPIVGEGLLAQVGNWETAPAPKKATSKKAQKAEPVTASAVEPIAVEAEPAEAEPPASEEPAPSEAGETTKDGDA